MKKLVVSAALIGALIFPAEYNRAYAQGVATPATKGFNDTEQILERALKIQDIEYKIMVQRATQTAIWAMPAAGMVDFIKATRRDLGGDLNDVVFLDKPFGSKHGFLTPNDVRPMPGLR